MIHLFVFATLRIHFKYVRKTNFFESHGYIYTQICKMFTQQESFCQNMQQGNRKAVCSERYRNVHNEKPRQSSLILFSNYNHFSLYVSVCLMVAAHIRWV